MPTKLRGSHGNGRGRPGGYKDKPTHVARTFSLSLAVDARIREIAAQQAVTYSRVIEDMVIGVNYRDIFRAFQEGKPLADVIIATNLSPAVVRCLYGDYQAGYAMQGGPTPTAVLVEHARTEGRISVERARTDRLREQAAADQVLAETRAEVARLRALVKMREADVRSLTAQLRRNSETQLGTRTAVR